MTAKVLRFDREFDATDMPFTQIRDEVERRGWPMVHLTTHRAFHGDGKLLAQRVSRKQARR